MPDVVKKITMPLEGDPSKLNKDIDKARKGAEKKGVEIPVSIDLSKIEGSLKGIIAIVDRLDQRFDKLFGSTNKDINQFKSNIKNFKKEITDSLGKVNELIKYTGKSKTPYINVGVMGFENLTQQVKTLVEDMKTLNSTNVNIDSFEKLLEVLKNIEKLTNSIVKGMNFDSLRPSERVQNDIDETTNKLEKLAKTEEKINKLESYLNKTGVNKAKRIIEYGDSDDVKLGSLISKLREYIELGGDLSKIKFKAFNVETETREIYSLIDVLEILEDEGKFDLIDEKSISNDVEVVRGLRTELNKLQEELVESKAKENRDLKVSIDTKSLDEFSAAITQALSKLENIKINIPEGTTFDGLSAENLNKIIGKLDEIVVNIKTISSLISTGIDTSKLENIEVGVEPNVDVAEFIRKIEEKLDNAVVNVKANVDLSDEEKTADNLVDDNVITGLKADFRDVVDDFGYELSETIRESKNDIEFAFGDVDYHALFSSLRNTLSDIVVQFQNSLNNVTFSGEQKNEIYNLLKQWKDASGIISRTRNTDAERAALLNQSNGKISNSYLFDKEGSFHGLILNELNRLESGVSGQIGELYDTWLHSHPFRKAEQGLKAIGSDIGFTVADIDLFKNKYLDEGVSNMMVSSNGKYANINWEGISKEIIDQVVKSFKASNIFNAATGKLVASKNNGIITEGGYWDFDKQSELMRSALINSMKSAGINDADSRFTFGNIEDLRTDLSHLHQEEQQAAEEAKELIDVFRKLGTVLDGFNGESFKFGISEESLNGVVNKLNEIVGLLKIIGRLDDDNVNVDSTVNDNVITTGVKPNISGYDFVTEIEREISGYKVPVGVKPDVEGYTFANQIENEIGMAPIGIDVYPNINPSEFINEVENDIQRIGRKVKVDVEPAQGSFGYAYNEGVSSESSQFENLEQKIKDVTAAVDNKTRAFQEEEQIVVGTVQREVTNLEVLDGQLLQVLSTIKEIKEAFSDSFNDNGFLSSINSLLERSDDLKNIYEILKHSDTRFKEVNNAVYDSNKKETSTVTKDGSSTSKEKSSESEEKVLSLKKAYQLLKDTKEEYFSLDKKKVDNTATDKEIEKLEQLIIKRRQAADVVINNTADMMSGIKFSNTGDMFENVFAKASQKIDELNSKLREGVIPLEEYDSIIKRIKANLTGTKTTKAMDFIDVNNLEEAKSLLKEIIDLESGGKAVIFDGDFDNSKQITGEWRNQRGEVQKLTLTYDDLSGAIMRAYKAQPPLMKSVRKFSDILKQGWQNVMQYTLSFVGFYEIIELVRKGVTVVKDLDTAFTEMRKVSDESVQSLRNFQDISFDIADKIGTTAQQIQQSTADWMRLGESLNEASISAEASNILFNVSEFENIDAATESLVAMSSAYSEFEKIEIVDRLNNIGNNYAIATDGIATALQKSASALQTAGNDIDEAIALVTAGNQVVQDPDSVGAGLRTIALRITGTEAAKAELEELGEDTEDFIVQTKAKSQEAIKDFTSVASNNFEGFDILDDNGNFKSTYEILLGIAEIYDEIVASDQQFGTNKANGLLETLAGKNRANIAASIIQNPEILKSVYEDSQDSEGSALEENEKYLESIEGHIAQLKNKWQEVWASSLNREQINFFLDLGKALLGIVETIGLLPSAGIIGALIGGTVYSDKIKAIPGVKEALD